MLFLDFRAKHLHLMTKAILAFADGTLFYGRSFGFEGKTEGEVVFNTGMTGYQEILTDPSYFGQIVTLTYPMIGNYGVNNEDSESLGPHAAGLLVKEYCDTPSNWRASQTLGDYLKENQIVGVEGLGTREIVRHIRLKGAMPAVLATGEWNTREFLLRAASLPGMAGCNLVEKVTCLSSKKYGEKESNRFFVVAYDFGIKQNIIRELCKRGVQVEVVPALTPADRVLAKKPDGVLLSNGPGDPAVCRGMIANVQKLIGKVPIMGICLGHQILALALGAKTFKLKFGHRGGNQPVKDLIRGNVIITSQNHGFAVDAGSFPKDLRMTQINLNDQTVEAFEHTQYPIISVQYHPEASPGPHDASHYFDDFIEKMEKEQEPVWTARMKEKNAETKRPA